MSFICLCLDFFLSSATLHLLVWDLFFPKYSREYDVACFSTSHKLHWLTCVCVCVCVCVCSCVCACVHATQLTMCAIFPPHCPPPPHKHLRYSLCGGCCVWHCCCRICCCCCCYYHHHRHHHHQSQTISLVRTDRFHQVIMFLVTSHTVLV